jgi:PD-(D/E)XK nuclease superfamily
VRPTHELITWLRHPEHKLPWCFWDPELGKLVFVVDNHLLSTYRNCPQHFFYANVEGYKRKAPSGGAGSLSAVERSWYLDYGVLLHKMLELYYKTFRNENFSINDWCITRLAKEWAELEMNVHAEHKEFKLIGGLAGTAGLLLQYATIYAPARENFRVIATEVSFGRNREVVLYENFNIQICLAGRMDMIIDDGYYICPLDHKTEGYFRNDPAVKYETDEGPTGYVFALSKMLPKLIPEDQILKRDCSQIKMNLISKKSVDNPIERFRRLSLRKTAEQLVNYQQRMVQTVEKLLADLETYAMLFPVDRNTTACTNWHMGTCTYRDVCRQGSKDGELATLANGYVKLPIWDTETVEAAV